MNDDHLVISLKEARKILGKKISDQLSDEELEKTIITMSSLARETIRAIREGRMKIPEEISEKNFDTN